MTRSIALAALMSFACGPTSTKQNELEVDETSQQLSDLLTTRSFGVWVYSPGAWIADKVKVDAFLSLLLKRGMNEVYLSTTPTLLQTPALAAFMHRLNNNGISAEALIGKTSWGTLSGRADMLSQLDRIISYNATHVVAERFRSVHLDVEPWIGTGSSTAWVAPLIQSYQAAHAYLSAKGLRLAVDFSGSKGANLTTTQRQSIVDACDKIVLMLYEATESVVVSRAERFLNGVVTANGRMVVMAVRAIDFTQPYAVVDDIDRTLMPSTGYRGWALFAYDELKTLAP